MRYREGVASRILWRIPPQSPVVCPPVRKEEGGIVLGGGRPSPLLGCVVSAGAAAAAAGALIIYEGGGRWERTLVCPHTHRQLRRKHNGNEDEQGSRQRFFPCTSIQMRDLPSFLPFLSSPSVHGYSGQTEYYNRPNMIFAICRKVFFA